MTGREVPPNGKPLVQGARKSYDLPEGAEAKVNIEFSDR